MADFTKPTTKHRADALKSELEGFKNRERDLVARAALAQTDLDTVQGELKRVQVRSVRNVVDVPIR